MYRGSRMSGGLAIDLSHGAYVFGLLCLGFSYFLEIVRIILQVKDRARDTPNGWPDHVWPDHELPHVTIQLPVCNEYYVVERIIDECCALEYPRDRLQIQVLDDSIDDTSALISDKVRAHAARGTDISHLRRDTPTGFKAGNLQHGLASARGDFVAIFDADFRPDRDFLQKTLGYFQQPDVGIVQAGIRHLNRNQSILTFVQDPFSPSTGDVPTRWSRGYYFNSFSGSGCVLRTACLADIGGWQADTLTEDLDVSVRAYLRGWRCVKLDTDLAGDELQTRMADFKNRTARCNTGPVQLWKKHVANTFRNAGLTPLQKLSVLPTLHCLWLSLPSVALLALASVPLVMVKDLPLPPVLYALPSAIAVAALIAISVSKHRVVLAGTVALHLGTSFRGAWGALVGLAGRRARFNRSTKLGTTTNKARGEINRYPIQVSAATFLEGGLAVYFLLALVLAFQQDRFWFAPFHLLCAASCAFVFALSLRELQAS